MKKSEAKKGRMGEESPPIFVLLVTTGPGLGGTGKEGLREKVIGSLGRTLGAERFQGGVYQTERRRMTWNT